MSKSALFSSFLLQTEEKLLHFFCVKPREAAPPLA